MGRMSQRAEGSRHHDPAEALRAEAASVTARLLVAAVS